LNLREEFLRLLETDIEFRYTVAGYLGFSEILKRLDKIEEEQVKLREDFNREMTRIWNEISKLREGFNELRKEQIKLREDFNKMLKEITSINIRLNRVEKTLEKLTVDIEEEARSIIKHRLKEMNIEIEVSSLVLPDLELNVYGASSDFCIIGEASVRANIGLLNELLDKFEKLKANYPSMLRKENMLVIYTSLALPELIEKAKEKHIWVLKATGNIVKA